MHKQLSTFHNGVNALLMGTAGLPAICYTSWLYSSCSAAQQSSHISLWDLASAKFFAKNTHCALVHQEPVLSVNLIFFANVDVLFWLLNLATGSTWLIDPYWTLSVPMICLFYQFNPSAITNPLRSFTAMALLWVWCSRLTWSYFRREEWQFGAQEDWRFAQMRKRQGWLFAFTSFWVVYVSQHIMLVGITLPFYAVHFSNNPWHTMVDTLIAIAAATGIYVAYLSDNQLREFMLLNRKRKASGLDPVLILDKGIWRYSRHPNYFGEQLWWWAVAAWAVWLQKPWAVTGTLINSLIMAQVTRMTEARMLRVPARAAAYRQYIARTSVWIPWPPRQPPARD